MNVKLALLFSKNNRNDKNKEIDLNYKVDKFIEWYSNRIKGRYTETGEYYMPIEMRNFIEKMAIWYELRYPDYEVNRLMPCCGCDSIHVSKEMFENNQYIIDLLDDNSDIKELDWDQFYNTHAFIRTLPWEERRFLEKPKYSEIVYFDPGHRTAHLHLTKKGRVSESEFAGYYTNGKIEDEELEGLHIKEVLDLFHEENITLPENNGLERAIKNYEDWTYQKEEMLNCVMYRIVARSGVRIGPRRAYLFAKEFNRNIEIPIQYAIDRTDPGLRLFINQYIKDGGRKDLECYLNYHSNILDNTEIKTISIQELIISQRNNAATFYTPEENELHERLVDILASRVEQDVVKKEKIKAKRLERKLNRK